MLMKYFKEDEKARFYLMRLLNWLSSRREEKEGKEKKSNR